MDPLSVAAGIAGLYQVVDLAVGRLQSYVKEVRGARKEIETLTRSMTDLADILRRLGDLAAHIDTEGDGDTWSKVLSIKHNNINACHQTVQDMQSILGKSDPSNAGSSRDGLIRKLRWPFHLAKTKSLIADIEKHKASLTLELLAQNAGGIQGLLNSQSKTKARMEELKAQHQERLEHVARRARREENLKVLGLLGDSDQDTIQSNTITTRHPDTCTWFTDGEEFSNWFEGGHSRLWLCGIPGAGKTVLVSWIIRYIQAKSRQAQSRDGLAFFYCSYQRDEMHHAHTILASLIRQLAGQSQESMEDLKEFYRVHYPEGESALTPSTDDFCELLQCMSKNFERLRIVIDALDEIPETKRSDIIGLLCGLACPRAPNIKIILASREDSDIRQRLTTSGDYGVVQVEAKYSDLRLYVEYELNKRISTGELELSDPALKVDILENLSTGAGGMFRWVVCQLDSLCDLLDDDSRQKALKSLPPNLGQSYERILERLERQSPQLRETVKKVLLWLVCIKHPISLAALAEAVTIKNGDKTLDRNKIPTPRRLLRLCSSLIRTSAGNTMIELAHFSVREFLMDLAYPDASTKFSTYGIQTENETLTIAKSLLTYLCMEDFGGDCPDTAESRNEQEQQYSLRTFAASHWDDYAHGHYDDPYLMSLMKEFFQPSKSCQFLCWTHDMLLQDHGDLDGDEKETRYNSIISHGADTSTLHWACLLAIPAICDWLVTNGCDINKTSEYFGTPLHCAIIGPTIYFSDSDESVRYRDQWWSAESRKEVVEILLKANADPSLEVDLPLTNYGYATPIFAALRIGEIEYARSLLQHGAVLCKDSVEFIRSRTGLAQGESVLSVDPSTQNSPNSFGHFVKSDTYTDFQALFSVIRLENMRDQDAAWFFDLAARSKSSQTVELHKHSSIDLAIPQLQARLRTAASNGLADLVGKIIGSLNGSVDEPDESGNTALHLAAKSGYPEIVRMLLKQGADVRKSNEHGETPLNMAVLSDHLLVVAILLEAGGDIRTPNHKGSTAVHLAATLSTTRVLKLLDQYIKSVQFDFNTETKVGFTPLMIASDCSTVEVVEYISETYRGVNLHATKSEGENCLHVAIAGGSTEKARFFIGLGLDPNTCTNNGSTSFHIAAELQDNSEAMIDLLLSFPDTKPYARRHDGANPIHLLCQHPGNSELQVLNRLLASCPADGNTVNAQWEGHNQYAPLHCLVNCAGILPSMVSMIGVLCDRSDIDMNIQRTLGFTPLVDLVKRLSTEQLDEAGSTETLFRAVKLLLGKSATLDVVDLERLLEYICTVKASNVGLWSQDLLEQLLTRKADLTKANQSGQSGYALILQQLDEARTTAEQDNPGWLRNRQQSQLPTLPMPVEAYSAMLCTALDSINDDTVLSTYYLGHQILSIAIRAGNEDLIWKVLRCPIDVDKRDEEPAAPRTALEWACVVGCSRSIARELVKRSCKLLEYDFQGFPPIHLACSWGSKEMVLELLARGADPNKPDTHGNNALFWAVLQTRLLDIVDMLIKSNVNVNNNNKSGEAALHLAAKYGCHQVIKRLLTTDVDLSVKVPVKLDNEEHGFTALHFAAQSGCVETINLLLDSGRFPGVDIFTTNGKFTPLHCAVLNGNISAVKALLDHSTSQNLPDRFERRTPLHYAAVAGFGNIVQMLLKSGLDCQVVDDTGATPEILALSRGHRDIARMLHEHIAKQRQSSSPALEDNMADQSSLLSEGLIAAIIRRDLIGCTKLIEYGADPAAPIPDCESCTPLIVALDNNHQGILSSESLQISKLLIEKGAPVNGSPCTKLNFPQNSPIHYAALFGSSELLEILLSKTPRNSNPLTLTPLHVAASQGHTDCMSILLDFELRSTGNHKGSNSEIEEACSLKDLAFAVNSEPDSVAKQARTHSTTDVPECDLMQSESMINTRVTKDTAAALATLSNGRVTSIKHIPLGTPLHLAIFYRQETAVDLLLNRIADVELCTLSDMKTPLHVACEQSTTENTNFPISIIQRLLKAGANLNCRDVWGRTPVMLAAESGQKGVLEELQTHGADFKCVDEVGWTAMHFAADNGHDHIVPFLLTNSLDPSFQDHNGLNALQIALRRGSEPTAHLILDQVENLDVYDHFGGNVFNNLFANEDCQLSVAKKLIAKVKEEQKSAMINNRPNHWITALYASALRGRVELIELLLEHGAKIDMAGGPLGSALIVACTMGRLDAVKVLVSRGAKTEFCEEGKQPVSAYEAAAHHKKIQEWLLANQSGGSLPASDGNNKADEHA